MEASPQRKTLVNESTCRALDLRLRAMNLYMRIGIRLGLGGFVGRIHTRPVLVHR